MSSKETRKNIIQAGRKAVDELIKVAEEKIITNTEDDVYVKFDSGKLTGGVDDEYTLLIAGLDYQPSSNVHFMPNIIVKSYSDSDDSDITGRFTLFLEFDSGNLVKHK